MTNNSFTQTQAVASDASARLFSVAQKVAMDSARKPDDAAAVVLRAALQLLREGFDPSNLNDEEIETHILEAARILLRQETDTTRIVPSQEKQATDQS